MGADELFGAAGFAHGTSCSSSLFLALLRVFQKYAAEEGPYQARARQIYDELRKNVVDNVATQCWEDLLIRPLPEILTPTTIVDMEAADIDRIAREPGVNADQRDSLTKTLQILELGLETCRRHVDLRIPGR